MSCTMLCMDDLLAYNRPMTATDWIVDIVIAAGAFGFGCLQLMLAVNLLIPDESMRRMLGISTLMPSIWEFMAVAFIAVPLVIRRRLPWVAFIVSMVLWAFFQMQMSSVSLSLIAPLVALFTLAYERSRTQMIIGGCLAIVALFVVPSAASSNTLASLTLVQNIAFVVAAALAGFAFRLYQEYLSAAKERIAEMERTRESEAQRRVEEERVRIAREVHDITAHSLSAVSIQAAAAERMIDTDPQGALKAIESVRATSKDALEEMRAMIGVLRNGDSASAPSTPTEGTEHLVDLVKYLEDAGISCDLDTTGYNKEAVPAYLDVALFGIAREACTNIVRHANAHQARIELSRSDDTPQKVSQPILQLIIEDDGCGFTGNEENVAGHGLEGMRERVRILDGTFKASRSVTGGFRICVIIPLGEKRAQESQHG